MSTTMTSNISRRHWPFACIGLALLWLATIGAAHAAVCRVTSDATDNGNPDGSNWAVAMPLQTALKDTDCTEVWVAMGVYKPVVPVDPTSVTNDEADTSFEVRAGVGVYGGFTVADTARSQRDPVTRPTVLSGDIDDNDTTDGTGVTQTADGIKGTNSETVVMIDGSTTPVLADTVLDGFTITAGEYTSYWGSGGLTCNADGNNALCSPTLRQINFLGNTNTDYRGGAMTIQAFNGASSTPTLENITFSGNYAGTGGGAMFNQGDAGNASPTLTNVVFSGNSADTGEGGAMYNMGFEDGGTSNPVLTNVTFSGNSASEGGAMYNRGVKHFAGDTSISSPILTNVTFSDNYANWAGSAIYNVGASGGISRPRLTNVTFAGNSDGAYGGVIHNYADGTGAVASPTLTNVILWDPAADEITNQNSGASSAITYSIVQGGCPDVSTACMAITDSDPLLGPLQDNGGFTPTMVPAADSPAVDAGNPDNSKCPATDQRGITRPRGRQCDMGAVEVVLAYSMVAKAGSGQTTTLWHDFFNPLVVQVLDLNGMAARNVRVHGQAQPSGDASATCVDGITNATGFAYVYCRANGAAGSYPVSVNAVGFQAVPPAAFVLTNSVGDGDTIFRDDFDFPGPRTSVLATMTTAESFAVQPPANLPEGRPELLRLITTPDGTPLLRVDALWREGAMLVRITRYDDQGRALAPGAWQAADDVSSVRVRRGADGGIEAQMR